jgi:hypothetical protein
MALSNRALLAKAVGSQVATDFGTGTALAPEQSSAFLDLIYDATPFSAVMRTERRRAKSGTIAKIGIGGRLLRRKTPSVDDARLARPAMTTVPYQTQPSRLDWEIEEEVFEENIEQEGYEAHVERLMADQIGRDLEDLHFNGDTAATVSSTVTADDVAFLVQNDGWLKLISTGGSGAHRVNGATIGSGAVAKGLFFAGLQALPVKYRRPGVRWIGPDAIFDKYIEYLSNRATAAGDAVLINGQLTQILGVDILRVPTMPTTRLLLADPKNFIAVNTREIRRRRTTEGREAIREDKRFYAVFLDDDPIIEEMDAIADVYGVDVAA